MKEKFRKQLERFKKNEKGFTLIEMIIVIAIIAVLAAILSPMMSGYVSEANKSKDAANQKNLTTAAEAAVTSVISGGTEPTAVVITQATSENGTDFANQVQAKLKQLLGTNVLDSVQSYSIELNEDGSVGAVSITTKAPGSSKPESSPSPSPAG